MPGSSTRPRGRRSMTEPTERVRRARKTTPDEATAAAYDAAWQADLPAQGPSWTARPWVDPVARAAAGKAARKRVPRVSHAAFEPAPGRDPIAILAAQEEDRLQELVPLRHERMAESEFAYYRGTPAVMAYRPRHHAALGHPRPGERRRAPVQLRAVRVPRANARVRRQRLRRDAARAMGVGRQAAGRERRDRGACQRLHRRPEPGGRDGDRPRLPPVDGPLRDHAPDRRLVHTDHGCRHPRGGRGERRCSAAAMAPPAAPGSRPSSRRPASATACAPSSR